MESEIHSTTVAGSERAPIRNNDILFNDLEYDRKFRALQTYLPFVDNLLLQSSGKIASDRLQSLQTMLRDTNTKMKYDVMSKCESVLQSLMKKMEAAKCAQAIESNLRERRISTESRKSSAATLPQPVQNAATKDNLNANEQLQNMSEYSKQTLAENSVLQRHGHENQPQAKNSLLSQEISDSQTSESSGQIQNNAEQPIEEGNTKLDTNPENRSMVLTLKLAAARTARNAETTQKVCKRVPITWDDTSSMAGKKSEIDTLKLAAARAARFASPPQILDPQKISPIKETSLEREREQEEATGSPQKCLDIINLKLAAARTTKQANNPPTVSVVASDSDQETHNFLQMSREKLKKLIPPDQKSASSVTKSPPRFQGSKFDPDSPRNDWDFQAAPGHWNPSPPTQNAHNWTAGSACDSENLTVAESKVLMSSEFDQISSQSQGSEGNNTPAVSTLGLPPMASFYSPIHGLVQRRISTVQDLPLSPDESEPNSAEAKRRLRDKLSQEINMVHRVGTSKGGSLRGLAAKESKAPPVGTKEEKGLVLGQEKKTSQDAVKKPEKIVEIDMFSKEQMATEHQKESPKILKGLYAPRYKSSHESLSAKSGILSSEHKPASRTSVEASRLMKSPPSDAGSKRTAVIAGNKEIAQGKLPETNNDSAVAHSRILSTMTTEELKRAVSLNVRNLPSPPTISALVLESAKSLPPHALSPSSVQPEKIILNPAFDTVPTQIEPGFFSKSDVDLRLEDPSAFFNGASDIDFLKKNLPASVNNRDPRTSYRSRFDREHPLSPDGSSMHHQGPEPGPRHITYHLNKPDGRQNENNNSRWPPNDTEGCLTPDPFLKPPIQEPLINQYSQNLNRDTRWLNGGHQQIPFAQGTNINYVPVGDVQGQQFYERNIRQSFGDQRAIQMHQERNRRLSGGESRDFRGSQFQGRNTHQPMANQYIPQNSQEQGRNIDHFSVGDLRSFQGSQFHSGSNQQMVDDQRLRPAQQDPARRMNDIQGGDSLEFRGTQFPGRNLHHPVGGQQGIKVPQGQAKNLNTLPAIDGRDFQCANYPGRNNYVPLFGNHEQQKPQIQGEIINHLQLGRNQDFPAPYVRGRNSHPPMNECRDQSQAPPHLIAAPTQTRCTNQPPLLTPYQEVPCAQGTNRDPRHVREQMERNAVAQNDLMIESPINPNNNMNTHDPYHWKKSPSIESSAAQHSPRPALLSIPTSQMAPKQVSVPVLSPNAVLEKRPAHGPISPLANSTPIPGKLLENPDCIPFKPPRIIDPRIVNRRTGQQTVPPIKGIDDIVPQKEMPSARESRPQHCPKSSVRSNKQRRQRSSRMDSTHRRYSDEHSRRGSWEAEEARRREEKRRSVDPRKNLKEGDKSSLQKTAAKGELVSPLNSLYGSTIIQKTGVGYGVQKFKIPKIKRPDPPEPVEVVIASVNTTPSNKVAEDLLVSEPVELLPVEQKSDEQKSLDAKLVEQKSLELMLAEQKPKEQPIVEKPHTEQMPVAPPSILKAIIQQTNLEMEVDCHQIMESLILIRNLKPNQLKKFEDMLKNSSSIDDSENDNSVLETKTNDSEFETTKQKSDGQLLCEDTQSKETEAKFTSECDLSANIDSESVIMESVIPDTRKLRGRKPGPLSAKKKALGGVSGTTVQPNDLDSSTEPVTKTKLARTRQQSAVEILQDDLLKDGTPSATSRLICNILKKDGSLTAAAKELPNKHTVTPEDESDSTIASRKSKKTSGSKKLSKEQSARLSGDESDVQASVYKKPSNNSKESKVKKKAEKSFLSASTRSGRSFKDVDRSVLSSDVDDASDMDETVSQRVTKIHSTSDSDEAEMQSTQDTVEMVDRLLRNSKTGPRKRKTTKHHRIGDLKRSETPSECSVEDEDDSPIRNKTSRKVAKLVSSESAIEDVSTSASDNEDENILVKSYRKKTNLRTQNKNYKKIKASKSGSGKKERASSIISKCKQNECSSTKDTTTERGSSIRKKKGTKPRINLYESSDSCVESTYSLVGTSTASEDGIFSAKPTNKIITLSSDKNTSSSNIATKSKLNLTPYVNLQDIMSKSSMTPSPSMCSSDDSSDKLPLTLLAGPTSRRVARRGGRVKAPRSRGRQPVSNREDRVSSEFDSSMHSEQTRDMFSKEEASVGNEKTSLDASISDIIDRLSKDDDEAKSCEVTGLVEGSDITNGQVPVTKNHKKKRRNNWSKGVIKNKRPKSLMETTKSISSEVVASSSEGSVSLLEDNIPENESESVDQTQEIVTQPPKINSALENATSVEKESEEMEKYGEMLPVTITKSPLESVNQTINSVVTVSAEHVENQIKPLDQIISQESSKLRENMSCDQPRLAEDAFTEGPFDAEENGSKAPIRNVDKDYCILPNLKSKRYPCKLCTWTGTPIVSHYALTHPDNETYIARLACETAENSIAESEEKGYISGEDVIDESVKHAKKKYLHLTCRMCFFKCTNFVQFYDHCCSHTGEFRYKCTQCAALIAGKTNLGSHYQYHHKEYRGSTKLERYTELFPLPPPKDNGVFAYVCSACNFVQMRRSNVEKHIKVHHAPESDDVNIVYINMHVESNKKRITLRKTNKKLVDDLSKESLDADKETKEGMENSQTSSIEGEYPDTSSQSADLAAFLSTVQESLGHTENASEPLKKDSIEKSDVSTFVRKFMPEEQNSIIDGLLRRYENCGEDKDDSTLNQPYLDSTSGNQTTSASLLADEMSLDSSLSNSTIMDGVGLTEPSTGTSSTLDDTIERLEQYLGKKLSEESDLTEFTANVKLEDFGGLQSPIYVGPFEVNRVDKLPVYGCNVENCNYSTVSAETFISHLKYNHVDQTWDGTCQSCENVVIFEEAADLTTAFLHLLKLHLSSFGVGNEEARRQVELYNTGSCDLDRLILPADAALSACFRIRTRRLSGDTLSKPEVGTENILIEDVVSLADTSPMPPVIIKSPPSLPTAGDLVNISQNFSEDNSKPITTNAKMPFYSLPKTVHVVPKPAQNCKPVLNISTTTSLDKDTYFVKKISPVQNALCTPKYTISDAGTSDDTSSKQGVKALVQCVQAKAEKDPTCYEKMLEKSKLRHLFKCMSRQCQHTTNDSVEFGRHVLEHKADKCCNLCAYCMKMFNKDQHEELIAHVQQEHGHCVFQCAHCFYRAVSPSYVFVHQNLAHTNKSISILQCLGRAKVDGPTIPLSLVIPKYVCGQASCEETFILTGQFILHLQESHAQIHNYSCHLCETVCFDPRNFIAHYRVHSLYMYQCRYCVHGASNEEMMHHHLCNFHPGQMPNAVMREADNEFVPVTVDSLKIIDLGDKNPVNEELIVKLPMDEMNDEIEPEETECGVSEDDAPVIGTLQETQDEAEDDVGGKTLEETAEIQDSVEEHKREPYNVCLKQPKPAEAEPICVIELDSEDDASTIVDLTGSVDGSDLDVLAAGQSRALRSSPRKSTEGVRSDLRGAEKRGAAKDEAAATNLRAASTTSFEFGAITLDDLNKTGLSGGMLFKCGFSKCDAGCETVEELREHLMVCDLSRNSHGLTCPHCLKAMKNLTNFCEHIRTHSICRYGCGLCVFRATSQKLVQLHLRARHRTTLTKIIPLNPLKFDPENDLFVVGPLRLDKRKKHLVSQMQSPGKKSRPKYVYQPDEGHLLPIGAIYPFIVTCATCSFTTKVRKNLERHLLLHKQGAAVPSQNQVNAVPCLETKEMMFDKMTNLAASSNLKAPDASNLYLTPEDVARLPKYVPEQQRYRCGADGCTYNSCDENMLIHHFRALHRDEDYYKCPHCPPASELDSGNGEQLILVDKLSLHLKMHDNRLYKCGYCFYYDHRRHIVERHVTDKHSDYKMHYNVVREPFSEGTPVVSAKMTEKEPSKEPLARFAWRCARCLFESATRPEMVAHSDSEHGKKLQYECGVCHSRFQSKQSFDQHCGFSHPGLKEQLLYNFFKTENATSAPPADAPFDTRPLWSRDAASVKHIRGILFEDDDADVAVPPERPVAEAPPPPAKEDGDAKESMFLCSICKTFETKVKADMKIHLYKELKYFRYQCSFCDKKVFSLAAGKKHMTRAHASMELDCALTLFEKDLETEQKVEEILAAQEDLMQLDNPPKISRAPRIPKAKASPVRHVKEVDVSEVSDDVPEPDVSMATEESEEEVELSESVEPEEVPTSKKPRLTKTLTCKDCSLMFGSVRGLKTHIRHSHLSQAKWICNVCQMTNSTKVLLENHSKVSHPESTVDPAVSKNPAWKPVTSPLTDDFWMTSYGIGPTLKKAKKKKNKGTPPSPPDDDSKADGHQCPHCMFRFASKQLRDRHEKRHWVQKPFRCGHCAFNGMREQHIKLHSEHVHPDLPFEAVRVEMPDRPDIRPITRRKRQRQPAAAKNLDDSPLPAKKVRADFSEVINLDSDEDIEVESLDTQHFKCGYCPTKGKTREVLRRHWIQAHKVSDDGDGFADTGLPFLCEEFEGVFKEDALKSELLSLDCTEGFATTKTLLKAHGSSQHPVVEEIHCPKCDFKTSCVETITEHLHRHSFDFKCSLCGESFGHKKPAKRHWQLKHPDSPYGADSFELNLDQYKSLRQLVSATAGIGKSTSVAKKSTTKLPMARKSTGNAPRRRRDCGGGRGRDVSPVKMPQLGLDLSQLSVKVPIFSSVVDMRVDTYTEYYNIYPDVVLVNCKLDPRYRKHFPCK